MSMIGNYCKLTKSQFDRLVQGDLSVSDFLYSDEPAYVLEEDCLDIDKAWDCIHYVLTGTSILSMAEDENEMSMECKENFPPLFNVVLGGKELNDEDIGYGPAHFLTDKEVADAYEKIKNITKEDFRADFDLDMMMTYNVYPLIDGEDEEELFEYVYTYFKEVQDFFKRATDEGKYMLFFIN